VFIAQAYQYVVPRGGFFFVGKWRSSFAGSSDSKMNVQFSLRSEHPIELAQTRTAKKIFEGKSQRREDPC
jgi:hypothetical protein